MLLKHPPKIYQKVPQYFILEIPPRTFLSSLEIPLEIHSSNLFSKISARILLKISSKNCSGILQKFLRGYILISRDFFGFFLNI